LAGGLEYQLAGCILPVPDQNNQYCYVAWYGPTSLLPLADFGIYYSLIDMNANGGKGKVIQKNIFVYEGQMTNHFAVCEHSNGKDWWVVTHGYGDNNFYKFLLTEIGVTFYDVQSIGTNYSSIFIYRFGGLDFSFDGNVMVSVNAQGVIEQFNFDRCTGQLSNPIFWGRQPLLTPSPNDFGARYKGVTFAPNSFCYIHTVDTLYQYRLVNNQLTNKTYCWYDTLNDPFVNMVSVYYDNINNKIYFSQPKGSIIDDPSLQDYYLGVIEHPDSVGPACKVRFNGLYLNGRRAPIGFGPRVNYNLGALGQAYPWPQNDLKDGPPPLCAGDSVRLGEWFSEPGIGYQWAPAAGLSCTTCHAPKAAPAQTTTYTLYTTSTNACGLTADTATVTVTILQPSQAVINLGSDRTICAGDSLTIGMAPVPNVAYSWNTDATTAIIGIRPEQTTTYILQAVDTSAGCGEPVPVLDTLTVTVLPRNVLEATLPPDTAVCPGASLTLTPVLTGTGSVLWSTGATTPSITVEPSQTTTYTVTFTGTACDTPGTATVTVTVLPLDASPCRTARPDATATQIRIYPNPTTGPLTVELPAGIRTDIDLLNAIGQGLLRVVNRSGTVHLDLTPYPDGHYYLTVKGQRTRVVLRK
jgi:hypothetical protein